MKTKKTKPEIISKSKFSNVKRDSKNIGGKFLHALEQLKVHDHLCLIYETQEEQFAAVIPFMKIGLERGEKCVYIADDNTAASVIKAMRTAGIDVDAAIEKGALAIITKHEAYLKQGFFDPDWMINFLKETTVQARASGFSALRVTGEMTWVLGGEAGVERLIEYESELNYAFPAFDVLAICQYNKKRFSPEIIKDVISTHPLLVYGETVCKNYYYVPPDEFLAIQDDKSFSEVDRLLKNILNRENAEFALQESEARYRKLIETEPECVKILTKDNILQDMNPAGLAMIEADSIEQVVGKSVLGIIDPEYREAFNGLVQRVFHGESGILQFKITGLKGTKRWLETHAVPMTDDLGNIHSLLSVTRDITERKRAEEALRESNEILSLFMKSSPIYAYIKEVTPKESRVIKASENFQDMVGMPGSQMAGKTMDDLFPPTFAAKITSDDWDVVAGGKILKLDEDLNNRNFTTIKFPITIGGKNLLAGYTIDITERKQAEMALEKSLSEQKSIMDTMPDIVFVLDMNGNLIRWNRSLEKVTGYSPEELFGKQAVSFFDKEHQPIMGQAIMTGFEKGYNEVESPLRRKDGTTIPYFWNGAIVRNGSGNVTGITGVGRDITERKRMEDALRKSESSLRAVLQSTVDGILAVNNENEVLYANEHFVQMWRIPQEIMVSKNDSVLLQHVLDQLSDPQCFLKNVQELYKSDRESFDTLYFRDGRVFERLSCPLLQGEKIQGRVWSFRDVTERQQAEEKMRESEEKFRTYIEKAPVGVFVSDLNGHFIDFNVAATDLLGYDATTLKKISLLHIYSEEDHEKIKTALENLRQGGYAEGEFCVKRNDGTSMWVFLSISLVGSNMALGYCLDITGRKQSERKIQSALQEKESLLREIHHRVKNNLQAMIALMKMRSNVVKDKGTKQFLKELEGQTRTMSLVYEQLYQSENLAQVSMKSYIGKLTSNVLEAFNPEQKLVLNIDIGDISLDVTHAMPCGLIVNELFTNILKHAFPPGYTKKPSVRISLRQEDDVVHLIISDNGVGVPEGLDLKTKKTLGLHLVNLWATHQLGGTLDIQGNKGATFSITFNLTE